MKVQEWIKDNPRDAVLIAIGIVLTSLNAGVLLAHLLELI